MRAIRRFSLGRSQRQRLACSCLGLPVTPAATRCRGGALRVGAVPPTPRHRSSPWETSAVRRRARAWTCPGPQSTQSRGVRGTDVRWRSKPVGGSFGRWHRRQPGRAARHLRDLQADGRGPGLPVPGSGPRSGGKHLRLGLARRRRARRHALSAGSPGCHSGGSRATVGLDQRDGGSQGPGGITMGKYTQSVRHVCRAAERAHRHDRMCCVDHPRGGRRHLTPDARHVATDRVIGR